MSSIFVEIDLRRNLIHEIKTTAWYGIFFTDVSGQPVGPIFKGQESSLEEGTDKLPPKRRQGITTTRCITTQKSVILIYLAAEA